LSPPSFSTARSTRSRVTAGTFTPITIGNVEIRNRILSTGHDTMLPTDGTVNDALIAYHAARAEGGAGLIVVQVAGIHDSARYTTHILMATGDECIPGYAKLARTVAFPRREGLRAVVPSGARNP
jgi:2,4-dienoyl-CoA reductase-like NADH-dependent reductase (Old Yellow Enzyme family)